MLRLQRVLLQRAKQQVKQTLEPLISDAESFFTAVRASRGVIGGSCLLKMFDEGRWRPNDLDVFVPSLRASRRLVRYLVDLRPKPFVCIRTYKDGRGKRVRDYPGALFVSDVRFVRFTPERIERVVQVIVVRDPVRHASNVDLTFLQNWCDGRSLVINNVTAVVTRHGSVARDCWPQSKQRGKQFLVWLSKYAGRGYSFDNLVFVPAVLRIESLDVTVHTLVFNESRVGWFFKRSASLNAELLEFLTKQLGAEFKTVWSNTRPTYRCYVPVEKVCDELARHEIAHPVIASLLAKIKNVESL
jgi:hypothetical protein